MNFNKVYKAQAMEGPVIVGQKILVELPDIDKDVKYFRARVLVSYDGPAEYRVTLN